MTTHNDIERRARKMGLEISRGGLDLVDSLEPLWLALFDHHLEIGAADLPVVRRSESWARRRRLYEDLLAATDAFVVLAMRGGVPVGYCLAHIDHGADDTWPTGDRIGDIESLALLPTERGAGLGSLLLDAAELHLADLGIHDLKLSVMTGNDRAMTFYRRRGMVPTLTTVLRLGSSSTPQPSAE